MTVNESSSLTFKASETIESEQIIMCKTISSSQQVSVFPVPVSGQISSKWCTLFMESVKAQ